MFKNLFTQIQQSQSFFSVRSQFTCWSQIVTFVKGINMQQDKVKHFIISGTLKKNRHWFPFHREQLFLLTQNNNSGMKWLICVLLPCHTHLFVQENKYFPPQRPWRRKPLRLTNVKKKKKNSSECLKQTQKAAGNLWLFVLAVFSRSKAVPYKYWSGHN